jgi:hypothetical protein
MRINKKYLGGLVLSAAFLVPSVPQLTLAASPAPVARHDNDHDKKVRRYYDTQYRVYRDWTPDEDRAYRHYLEERREQYRDFSKLKKDRQREYWRWRHDNPNWDRDRDRDRH